MRDKAPYSQRQSAILTLLRQQGRVQVEDLVAAFGTTPQTIRKDLQALADAHEVTRFHGGASLLAGVEYTGFEARRKIASEEKKAIAEAVAARIPNSITMMINVGTTTAAVAAELRHHAQLKVVTDNVNIANDLRTMSGVEVIVPGGTVRRSDGAILGDSAVSFISQFRADFAVIGISAIASDGALLDFDLREAYVARAIIDNARHVILAADSTKFSRSGPVKIGDLLQVHTFVTDRCTSPAIRDYCEAHDIELVEALPE